MYNEGHLYYTHICPRIMETVFRVEVIQKLHCSLLSVEVQMGYQKAFDASLLQQWKGMSQIDQGVLVMVTLENKAASKLLLLSGDALDHIEVGSR